ncbi:UDP-2,3-diacylglucosamine hydrolase [Lebetimonas natsushimae]|uniref:UDP-2,3-diacylglucosamine hydrolase n=2 Tax=Lebetimonas natsushimae TaxID=1936991 RepID=A0A292YCV7_9BACT|nr:UDP-2,3-diacylglucosamine hydrolase [Lebetimonas natsushimae]
MLIKEVEVKNGAVFVTDVHYKKEDEKFLNLLKNFIKNPPPQIFFLGDIFHLLLPFEFLYEYNKSAIELINELSAKTEIYYIYGNHDFCIDEFFPKINFADAFVDKKNSIYLSHGDLDTENLFYRLYSFFIRNRFTLNFLNFITFNFINNYLFKKLLNKKIKCNYHISNIQINKPFKHVIIGHYHNFKIINNVLILSSFYCSKNYYIIQIDKKINFKEINYGR